METFDQFEQRALAEGRVDFDGVFAYQCVDLILEYAASCFDVRGERGNAIDYWTNTSPVLLDKFDKIATQDIQRGDVVVLNGLTGNPYGHVVIATGNVQGDKFEGLEQNGSTGNGNGTGGDAIRTRFIQKVRIAGVLRPKVAAPPPPPPAPVQTSAEGTYNVNRDIPGYYTSANAAERTNPVNTVHPGNYHVFNEAHGMVNVTSVDGQPGSWINPADNPAPEPPPAADGPNYDGNAITIQSGWGLSNAAESAGYPDANSPLRWANIALLNGSDDWQSYNAALKPGQRIVVGKYQLPVSEPAPTPPPPPPPAPSNITYTKLDEPLNLVTKQQPTHVWQLDFASYAEAQAALDLPQGAPFVAYGKAQRTDLDHPAYFMAQDDFGNADSTGVPTNNRGINTVDLSAAPPPESPIIAPPPIQAQPPEDTGEKIDVKVLPPSLDNRFQYTAFLSPQRFTAVKVDTHVKELQGLTTDDGSLVHPDQQLVPTQLVLVAGKMVVDGQTYYRTAKSVENKLYYAIPLEDLTREDDLTEDELKDLLKDSEEFLAKVGDGAKKALKARAQVDGFFARLFHRNKK